LIDHHDTDDMMTFRRSFCRDGIIYATDGTTERDIIGLQINAEPSLITN